jgi:hypothetical protein
MDLFLWKHLAFFRLISTLTLSHRASENEIERTQEASWCFWYLQVTRQIDCEEEEEGKNHASKVEFIGQ